MKSKIFSFCVAFSRVPVLSHFLPICSEWCKNLLFSQALSKVCWLFPVPEGNFVRSQSWNEARRGTGRDPVIISTRGPLTWCVESMFETWKIRGREGIWIKIFLRIRILFYFFKETQVVFPTAGKISEAHMPQESIRSICMSKELQPGKRQKMWKKSGCGLKMA